MDRNIVETLLGAVVLAVAVGFGWFAYQGSNVQPRGGYELVAKFDVVDGIAAGSDVRVGGVKVGVVSDVSLDVKTYRAMLRLSLQQGIEMPVDSTAAIVSESLLGGKYVSLQPGAEDEMLASGGEITFTQSSVNLESLIGRFMFSGGGVDKEGEAPAPAAAPAAPAAASGLEGAL